MLSCSGARIEPKGARKPSLAHVTVFAEGSLRGERAGVRGDPWYNPKGSNS
jgi:hypothetical protein